MINKDFYPSLDEFLKAVRANKLYESGTKKKAGTYNPYVKLDEQKEVISPKTGLKYDMKAIVKQVEKAKDIIVRQSPLFRPYVHELTPTIYTWMVRTMATDGVRLFINPEFASKLNFTGMLFVLLHEIFHCVLMHMERGEGFEHRLFNKAADYEINALLVDTMHEDFTGDFVTKELKGLYDKKYLNSSVEEIYRDLLQKGDDGGGEDDDDDLVLDPTQMGKGDGGDPPPKGDQPPKKKKAKIELTPGTKVKIKATGQIGVVKSVNSDGTFEVDVINEELFIHKLLAEGYSRDQLIPILPGGKGSGGEGNIDIEDEYETEGGEGEGDEGEGGEDREGQGSGGIKDLTPEQLAEDIKRVHSKVKGIDPGGTGAIIDKRIGEQIAKLSGYSDAEAQAGTDPKEKWHRNATDLASALKSGGRGAGTGAANGALYQRLKKILKSSVDWKTMLKLYVGRALSPEKIWRIGAKKHLHKSADYLKRGQKQKKDALAKAIIAVDFSGSMFRHSGDVTIFDRCLSEIQNIIYAQKIKEVVVIYFDDGVDESSVQTIKRGQKTFIPKREREGGGTNFQKPLDYIKEKYNNNVNLCIFLTDGEAAMPAQPPYHKKFIWVVYDNEDFKPPFGKAIVTTRENLGE